MDFIAFNKNIAKWNLIKYQWKIIKKGNGWLSFLHSVAQRSILISFCCLTVSSHYHPHYHVCRLLDDRWQTDRQVNCGRVILLRTGMISHICPCDSGAAPVCWRRSSISLLLVSFRSRWFSSSPLYSCEWNLLKNRFSSSFLSRLTAGCLSFTLNPVWPPASRGPCSPSALPSGCVESSSALPVTRPESLLLLVGRPFSSLLIQGLFLGKQMNKKKKTNLLPFARLHNAKISFCCGLPGCSRIKQLTLLAV